MNNNFIRTLPMMASVLGQKYGVRVKIGGSKAASNGTDIFIPALPLDSPSEVVHLARGYLDHEAAHIRETDMDLVKAARLKPLEMHILNIIEDWRVEKILGEKYPGCRQNFEWLIRNFFDQDSPNDTSPDLELLNWMLLTMRGFSVPEIQKRADQLACKVKAAFPGLVESIQPILNKVRTDCHTTKEAIKYTRKIIQVLKSSLNGQNSSKQGFSKSKTNDANSSPCMENGSKTEKESGNQEQKLGANLQDQDSDAEPNGKNDLPNRGELEKHPNHPISVLESLLAKDEGELPPSIGSILESCLNTASNSNDSTKLVVAMEGRVIRSLLSPAHLQEARKVTLALKIQLQNQLQSSVLRKNNPGHRGQLATKAIHRLFLNDSRIFQRTSSRTGINTAVHLLADISGSMRTNIELVSLTIYAFCKALKEVHGINVGVSVFPALPLKRLEPEQDPSVTVAPVLRHGDVLHHNFNLHAEGGTPMGEALWWVIQEMARLPESRKIIFILTDGEPNNPENVQTAIAEAGQLGYEIYGLGLACDSVKELMTGKSVVIDDIKNLPANIFKLLGQAIIRSI